MWQALPKNKQTKKRLSKENNQPTAFHIVCAEQVFSLLFMNRDVFHLLDKKGCCNCAREFANVSTENIDFGLFFPSGNI